MIDNILKGYHSDHTLTADQQPRVRSRIWIPERIPVALVLRAGVVIAASLWSPSLAWATAWHHSLAPLAIGSWVAPGVGKPSLALAIDQSWLPIRDQDSASARTTTTGPTGSTTSAQTTPTTNVGLQGRADVVPPAGPLSAGPDFSAAITTLRAAAMGMIKGCNYAQYLALADSLASAMQTFRSLDGGPPSTSWAVPFLDPISMLFRSAAVMAARKTAQSAHEGLAYQLEQVCNSVVQADQVNRQVQLLTAAAQNIEHPIRWLMQELNLGITHVPGAEQTHVQANWTRLYTNAAPHTGSPSDTMWEAIDTTLRGTLSASSEMHTALDSLVGQLQQTEQEMLLFAWPDSLDPTTYDCPTGYPDPNRSDVEMVGTQRVCGPATPERQAQITAHLDLLKTQIRALQVSATARDLEVESVGLMADNEGRKITNLNRNASVLAF